MNILKKANEIVNERSEEKERQYGNFDKSMELVARLFNAMTNDKYGVTAEDMYTAMIAMKFARQANAHKEDNLLDAVAYIGAMNNYIERKKEPKTYTLEFEFKGAHPSESLIISKDTEEKDSLLERIKSLQGALDNFVPSNVPVWYAKSCKADNCENGIVNGSLCQKCDGSGVDED